MNKDLIILLKQELQLLADANSVLQHSFKSCKKIGIKKKYSEKELVEYEAFASRFARTSDIFIQKILRLIDELDAETQVPPPTPMDRMNRAEKKGVVESAEKLIEIRKLRNTIAHEYIPEAIKGIFKSVLNGTPYLLSCITQLQSYCKKYF